MEVVGIENEIKMNTRRKVTASLNPEQFAELEALMKEDGQTNYTFYLVYLIKQEGKRREAEKGKRAPGRPKKEDTEEVFYPSPDPNGGRAPYSKEDWEAYFTFRKEEVPPLPAPLTKEELKKWEV